MWIISLNSMDFAGSLEILSSMTYKSAPNQWGGLDTITLIENTDVSSLSQSGTDGGPLKENVGS